jgi:hypothetical protein
MTAPPETTEQAIARVHAESAERGRALIALAKSQNDVGGPDESITAMSAVVDMLHAVADMDGATYTTEDVLKVADSFYVNDMAGEW